MRIISGKLGGRKIRSSNEDTRPAMGRTREALFSMLVSRGLEFENLRALDLFAGTGSLGFEAASRGAAHIDFVDKSAELCKLLRFNAEVFDIAGQCGIFCEDVKKFLARGAPAPYGLIFVDPPYRQNLTGTALQLLVSGNFGMPGTLVCAEVEKNAACAAPENLRHLVSRNFGQTVLNLWVME